MQQPASTVQPFGRYELLALLARGGMAEVFLARMTGVGGFSKLLVIKRILPHLRDDPDFHDMFLNEGRIAARLSHPNVCHVYELGEVDGDTFLAMEYLEGLAWADLVDRVPQHQAFGLRCAAGVIGQVCDGLRYAHELRDVDGTPMPVVHRDVSPQNVMVTTDGVCKLLDFGVSKVLTEGTRTRTGMLKGKLPYMAPEQIRAEPLDVRADVFSIGVVLWEAMTRERLFKRDSDYLIWRAITEEEVPPVSAKVPGLPPALDRVIARALERDAARRYPSIRAFASDLKAVADTVGGPLDNPQIAAVLRQLGAEQLAERARIVSAAVGKPLRLPQQADERAHEPEPSATHSIRLRDHSVRLDGRRPSSRSWVVALAAAVALGCVAAVVSLRCSADGSDERPFVVEVDAAAPQVARVEPDASPVPDAQPIEADAGAPPDAATPVIARPRPPRRPPPPPSKPPGQYSIDSRPYATIYIDGRSYGATPLFQISLPAGRHRVRAVRADGRARDLVVTIESGKLFSSGTITW